MDDANNSGRGKSTYTFAKTSVPGVFRRGERNHVAFRFNGKLKWDGGYRTLDEARRAKHLRQADVTRGEYQERSTVTVAALRARMGGTLPRRTARVP